MGLDLTVEAMRAPLLAAYESVQVPAVALFDPAQVPAAVRRSAAAYPAWRALPVASRADILRRAADAMEARMPQLCACWSRRPSRPGATAWPKCAKPWTSCAITPCEAERIQQPMALPGCRPARATNCG